MKKETFIKAWARELSVSEDDLYDFYNKVITFENQEDSAGKEVYVKCDIADPDMEFHGYCVNDGKGCIASMKKVTRPTVNDKTKDDD
jgi:hypothetical protein